MDSPQNYSTDPCPTCGKGEAEVMGVLPIVVNGEIILPHCYSLCKKCHAKQYSQKYGYTPVEAPTKVPPRKILLADGVKLAIERKIKIDPKIQVTSDELFAAGAVPTSTPRRRLSGAKPVPIRGTG